MSQRAASATDCLRSVQQDRAPLEAVQPTDVPVLEAESLSAGYGSVPAVHSINMSVARGEVVALLGANGAGKTTVLRALAGDVPLSAGRVKIFGTPSTAPLHRRVRRGMRYVT